MMNSFDISAFRSLFPAIMQNDIIYFDNGATTQKPSAVIEATRQFYQLNNANVHRSSHRLGAQSTHLYEAARGRVANFIKAKDTREVIWTKGTTESINLVAATWGEANINKGDEIAISAAEHHANIVPWQQLAHRKQAKLVILPLTAAGVIDVGQAKKLINSKTKLIACAHVSNVLGKINPLQSIVALARQVDAKVLIDGAQAIASVPVDVQQLDCDFYAFSAHKIYGPTGLGVLYGKAVLLEQMPPYQMGGEMIKSVTFERTIFNELPHKFEAGTPNIAAVIGFTPALDLVETYQLNCHHPHKQLLIDYTYEQLCKISEVTLLAEGKPDIPLFSFTGNFDAKDLAAALDAKHIAIRSGYMCAMPLMHSLGIKGCVRIALGPYNTKAEIDVFIATLQTFLLDELSNDVSTFETAKQSSKSLGFINHNSDELIMLFSSLKGWDVKHRQIMLLGKRFERMNPSLRSEVNLIAGCESDAWLVAELDVNQNVVLRADSQAKVIRGLLYIVFAAYQHKRPSEILAFDIENYFLALGLIEHLSPSRSNGLRAIVAKINQLAQQWTD